MSSFFLPMVVLLTGLGLIAIPLAAFLRSRRIALWPRVPAIIICSTVTNPSDPEKGTWPDVQYEYLVEGIRYVGKRVYAQANSALAVGGDARKVCQQYPVGKTVWVFVNPANHSDCALEAKVEPKSVAFLLGYGSFTVAVVCYALFRVSF